MKAKLLVRLSMRGLKLILQFMDLLKGDWVRKALISLRIMMIRGRTDPILISSFYRCAKFLSSTQSWTKLINTTTISISLWESRHKFLKLKDKTLKKRNYLTYARMCASRNHSSSKGLTHHYLERTQLKTVTLIK